MIMISVTMHNYDDVSVMHNYDNVSVTMHNYDNDICNYA